MPRILFLSESCLLDRNSGAAQSVREILRALAAAGWQARAMTFNCCDGEAEQPLAAQFPVLDPARSAGQVVDVDDGPVRHRIRVLRSTRIQAMRPWDMREFHEAVTAELLESRPDLVFSYGSDYLRPLLAQAQRLGARTVAYLANPHQTERDRAAYGLYDCAVSPTAAMAALCREKLGIEPAVVHNIVPPPFDGQRNLEPARIAARAQRFVTMINPQPNKGGLFFINIAAQMAVIAPQLRFRAVESRWGRAQWAAAGVAADALDRIEWHPPTSDMARIYEEAALLLVPSLWFEAAGRVIAEALPAGVPVLAMRSGGIPEQLNGGGLLFDLPADPQRSMTQAPELSDVQPWVQYVRVLMDKDEIYTQAVRLALLGAAAHDPQKRRAEAVAAFSALIERPLLPGVDVDAAARAALRAERQRVNAEREAINASVEANEPGASAAGQDSPYLPLLKVSLAQPAIQEALAAVNAKEWPKARGILEQFLRMMPEDLTALCLLAEVADAEEHEGEARELLQRVVELAPGFVQGQQRLLTLLRNVGDAESALTMSMGLIERSPNQPRYLSLHAGLLVTANRFEEAIAVYDAYFRQRPGHTHDWMQYGLALKTLGRQEEAVAAYRKAIGLAPGNGGAWHALSNMKLAVFTDADIALMREQLDKAGMEDESRFNMHFTLGKALEDQKDYAASFTHYAEANRIRRSRSDYDVKGLEDYVAQAKALFTPEFFAARAGQGHAAGDPVFVLGMHRAGSTLVEQILSSHSAIEGTRELPHLLRIGRDFGGIGPRGRDRGLNAGLLRDLGGEELARLGAQYLELSAPDRHTARPLFVDKMPANWMYAGLIHLILPNARIVDIRRAPMAAGFALFKMNFGRGVDHSYDQRDIARYYRAYVDLMDHFRTVLPGRVHLIRYEDLVENTDAEIRRLIDYCGLPFEESCLRYWETDRAIQTPSSEQVRQPIFKSAVEQWRNYEPWLGPMKEAFGDLLAADPAAAAA